MELLRAKDLHAAITPELNMVPSNAASRKPEPAHRKSQTPEHLFRVKHLYEAILLDAGTHSQLFWILVL